MATKVVFITSGVTFTVPSDFLTLVSVEAIGGGGSGAGVGSSNTFTGGGAGGAYAKSTSVSGLSANQTVYVNIGSGGAAATRGFVGTDNPGNPGGDTWFNTSNSAPSSSSTGVLAKGGGAGLNSLSAAQGGQASASVGDVKYSGGNGPSTGSPPNLCGAGGGAAGPGGAGGAGGYATVGGFNGQGAGGGGSGATLTLPGTAGANGGTGAGGAGGASTGQTGGAGATSSSDATVGVNGGGGGGGIADSTPSRDKGQDGGAGTFWIQTSNSATAGSGGGGGGPSQTVSSATIAGNGGLYGAGGAAANGFGTLVSGAGAQGIVVFTYSDSDRTSSITGVTASGLTNIPEPVNGTTASGNVSSVNSILVNAALTGVSGNGSFLGTVGITGQDVFAALTSASVNGTFLGTVGTANDGSAGLNSVYTSASTGVVSQQGIATILGTLASGVADSTITSSFAALPPLSPPINSISGVVAPQSNAYVTITSADAVTGIVTTKIGPPDPIASTTLSGLLGTVTPFKFEPTNDFAVGYVGTVTTTVNPNGSFVVIDRTQEYVTGITSTSIINISGLNVAGYQAFVASGQYAFYYTITDGINWETGLGAYGTTGGAGTINVISVLASSNGGNSISKTAGMRIFITYAAATTAIVDNANNCNIPFGPTNAPVSATNISLATSMSS